MIIIYEVPAQNKMADLVVLILLMWLDKKMSCSVPVFACIQDINRVISILNDAPISAEQDVKENIGK